MGDSFDRDEFWIKLLARIGLGGYKGIRAKALFER